VPNDYTLAQRQAVLDYFVEHDSAPSTPQERRPVALSYIVLPILHAAVRRGDVSELMHEEYVSRLMVSVINPAMEPGAVISDALNVELLKLVIMFVAYSPPELVTKRKELIKFAWALLKSTDIVTKQWAYVLACVFIETFETPPKIIIQIFRGAAAHVRVRESPARAARAQHARAGAQGAPRQGHGEHLLAGVDRLDQEGADRGRPPAAAAHARHAGDRHARRRLLSVPRAVLPAHRQLALAHRPHAQLERRAAQAGRRSRRGRAALGGVARRRPRLVSRDRGRERRRRVRRRRRAVLQLRPR
jgi:hypothetical protein